MTKKGSHVAAAEPTSDAWTRRRDALARSTGVRTLARPLRDGRTLPLAYTRIGERSAAPVLVLPGGPGLASVLPYQRFRSAAARRRIDLLMIEHRGVGLSRKADDGIDIADEDIAVDEVLADIVAVLDAEGIDRITVYGSSYGSYLSGAFGANHPDRVAGMVLDSAMLDASSKRATAQELNRLYWHGTERTLDHARRIRQLAEDGKISVQDAGFPLQFLHETGGPGLVGSVLDLIERGRSSGVWSWLQRLGATDAVRIRPFLMEFDLVARTAFTELGYGLPHDIADGPLHSDTGYAALGDDFPPFVGNPLDIRAALPSFEWPLAIISGDRDVRTPQVVAEEATRLAPNAALVSVASHGHSALDTAPKIALEVIEHVIASPPSDPASPLSGLSAPQPLMARLIKARVFLAGLRPGRKRR